MVDLGLHYYGRYTKLCSTFWKLLYSIFDDSLRFIRLMLNKLVFAFQFTLACIKMGRRDLARRAVEVAEKRLSDDKWPEYYDTRTGRFIGKQSRLYQTWTIAGYLSSKMLLDCPEMASILICDEDFELLEGCACSLNKSARTKCSRRAAKSQVLV